MDDEQLKNPDSALTRYLKIVVGSFTFNPKLEPALNISRTFNTYAFLLSFPFILIYFLTFKNISVLTFFLAEFTSILLTYFCLIITKVKVTHTAFKYSGVFIIFAILIDLIVIRFEIIDRKDTLYDHCAEIREFFAKNPSLGTFKIEAECREADRYFWGLLLTICLWISIKGVSSLLSYLAYRKALELWEKEEERLINRQRFTQLNLQKTDKKLGYTVQINDHKKL